MALPAASAIVQLLGLAVPAAVALPADFQAELLDDLAEELWAREHGGPVEEAAGAVPVQLTGWPPVEHLEFDALVPAMAQAYLVSTVDALCVSTFALANPLAEKHWEAEAVAPAVERLWHQAEEHSCHRMEFDALSPSVSFPVSP